MEKYWIYRERIKNFVLSNGARGGGIPANERTRGEWFPSGHYPQTIGYDDAPWMIGYWIGTLAMEYKVLNDNGHDVSQTKKDLFYAIDALLSG